MLYAITDLENVYIEWFRWCACLKSIARLSPRFYILRSAFSVFAYFSVRFHFSLSLSLALSLLLSLLSFPLSCIRFLSCDELN